MCCNEDCACHAETFDWTVTISGLPSCTDLNGAQSHLAASFVNVGAAGGGCRIWESVIAGTYNDGTDHDATFTLRQYWDGTNLRASYVISVPDIPITITYADAIVGAATCVALASTNGDGADCGSGSSAASYLAF